jgi:hypothetical protein
MRCGSRTGKAVQAAWSFSTHASNDQRQRVPEDECFHNTPPSSRVNCVVLPVLGTAVGLRQEYMLGGGEGRCGKVTGFSGAVGACKE